MDGREREDKGTAAAAVSEVAQNINIECLKHVNGYETIMRSPYNSKVTISNYRSISIPVNSIAERCARVNHC